MAVSKIILAIAVVSVCRASEPAENSTSSPEPQTHPRFNYSYGVHDPSTGDSKNLTETREGSVVRGSYNLVEPDGTIRTVRYTSGNPEGFRAVVEKSGTPTEAPATPEVLTRTIPVYPVYSFALTPVAPVAPVAPAVSTYSVPVYPAAYRYNNEKGTVYSFTSPATSRTQRFYHGPTYQEASDVVPYGYLEAEAPVYGSLYRFPAVSTFSSYKYQQRAVADENSDSRSKSSYMSYSSPDYSYSY